MVNLGTICTNCCFFDEKNEKSKCKHNLLEHFEKNGGIINSTDDGFSISRVCQYKRDINWNADKSEEEKMNICKNEIYLYGTVAVISLSDNINELDYAISKIENSDNFKFIIFYKSLKYNDLLNVCGNKLSDYLLIHIVDDSDIKYHICKSLKSAKNGYLFIIDTSKDFDGKIIDKTNTAINKKMLRVLHIEGTDDIHESVTMAMLYKYINGDTQCLMKEKLLEISKEENSDPQIYTWKEINDQYLN